MAISRVVDLAHDAVAEVQDAILRGLAEHRRMIGKTDAAQPGGGLGAAARLGREAAARDKRRGAQAAKGFAEELGRASAAGRRAFEQIDAAARRFASSFNADALQAVVEKFGTATSDHQRRQLDAQVRAAIGVPLSALERPVRDNLDAWGAANVDLIVTVPERYFDRLRGDVLDAYEAGTHPNELAADFSERYDIALNDAKRIARDQIGKLNGEVNQARQEGLGVSRFVWRTMNDGRVRESHEALEGESFSWDDPPVDEETGEVITPGSAIQCRCFAEPDLSELLGEAQGEEASADAE